MRHARSEIYLRKLADASKNGKMGKIEQSFLQRLVTVTGSIATFPFLQLPAKRPTLRLARKPNNVRNLPADYDFRPTQRVERKSSR